MRDGDELRSHGRCSRGWTASGWHDRADHREHRHDRPSLRRDFALRNVDAPVSADVELLDGPDGAHLVAYLGQHSDPYGWWPNDDRDAFAVALGQWALAIGLVDDDQEDDERDPGSPRSLVGYLAGLNIVEVDQALHVVLGDRTCGDVEHGTVIAIGTALVLDASHPDILPNRWVASEPPVIGQRVRVGEHIDWE